MTSRAARLRSFAPLASVGLLTGALWVLHHELAAHHPREIILAVRSLPWRSVVAALALTVASYAFLPAYDAIGLRFVGRHLGWRRTMFAGFLAYGFSQTLGFALLTGGSIRFRLYSAWGLSAAEVAQMIAAASAAFWLGVLTLLGVVLAVGAGGTLPVLDAAPLAVRAAGVLLLLVPIGYVAFVVVRRGRGPIAVLGWELPPITPALSLTQIAVGCLDWTLAASVTYVLLPVDLRIAFLPFVGVFVLAQVVGLISHVPGGLGVFESVVLLLLKGQAPAATILGSVLAYRVIYYVVPFSAAAITLAAYELRARRAALAKVARVATGWLPALAPRAAAGLTFLMGALLLFSGALPAEHGRLRALIDVVPLPVIEFSHFLGSLVGVGLLILAWGLARRLDGAFHLAVWLLAAGMAFSLLKGIDYEEAVVSGVVLVALLATRSHFDRKASLLHEPFSGPWAVATGVVLVVSVWFGLFAFRHVPYRGELWWRFALFGDAPRFLRAAVGTFVAAGAFGLARLLRPARPARVPPTAADLTGIEPIVIAAPRTYAQLAFLGDKSLLVNDERTAFIMYGTVGRSWIAMGDPIGLASAAADLVWRFRELADDHDGLTVFYQATPGFLPVYLDLGLRPLKLGEEGRVFLPSFSLEGGSRKSLRRVKRQIEKEGCTFAVLPTEETADILADLRVVSDAWLVEKATREKGFSLGRFDPEYLRRFPTAVVRRAGRIVAFANVWLGGGKAEVAPDLMRFLPDAPDGVMEYLFIELMLWGAAEGYEWFNVGMAPLSGMEARALAPLWNRVNALVYRHGENFYNFQGLRAYKEKFDPEWSPRYLAAPGGFALPRVIADVASLISGGLTGVVRK